MATRRWQGDAKAVAYTRGFTVGGTIASETFTFTINGKDIAYTADGSQTAAQVATALQALLAASDEPEFAEVTWTVDTAVITATGATAGKPVSISVAATGSATLTAGTETAATGPNHWDNADNWSGGAVPVDSDDVIIENGGDILYGLAQSSVLLTSLTIRKSYTGRIGLPEIANAGQDTAYAEYRDTYLAIGATTVTIGDGDGSGSGRIKINFGTDAFTANVYGTGSALETGIPCLLIKGSNAANVLNVLRGSVGVAIYAGETAQLDHLRTGDMGNPDGDAQVTCGAGVTHDEVVMGGGVVSLASATTVLTQRAGSLTILAGAHAAITQTGGVLYYRGTGTVTSLIVSGRAVCDFSRDPRARTVTTATAHIGATIKDPLRTLTITNGLDLVQCRIADVTLDLGANINLAVTGA